MDTARAPHPKTARRRRPARRLAIVVVAWVVVLVLWFVYQHRSGFGPAGATQRLVEAARGSWWAIAAFVLVSIVRPLVLFPATLVTAAAGMLFGPVVGILIAVAAANASALVGYSIGRFMRPAGDGERTDTHLASWTSRLRRNSFEAVLLMRLLFLPYDLVNYGCGLLKVGRRAFLTATAIGSLPGTVAFTLLGASLTRIDHGIHGVDRRTLVASAGLIAGSLLISRLVRRRAPSSA